MIRRIWIKDQNCLKSDVKGWKTGVKLKEIVKKIVETIENKDNIIIKDRTIIFEE